VGLKSTDTALEHLTWSLSSGVPGMATHFMSAKVLNIQITPRSLTAPCFLLSQTLPERRVSLWKM
jgi:hypothetical protein